MNKNDCVIRELNLTEQKELSGGWINIVLGAATIFGAVCLLAAGAGYIYGKLTCACKE